MAKIENTTAYPTVTPAADDLLIGTDVNNSNETVTFKISDIVGAGGVAQDLQSVLTTGDTAIEDINLTGDITVIGTVHPTTITALGNTGNPGQLLSSTGGGLLWIDSPTVTCCSLNDVLTSSVGANIATTAMTLEGVALTVKNAGGSLVVETPATVDISGTTQFSSTTVNLIASTLSFDGTSQINDSAGLTGALGSFLTSTATGVEWSTTLPSLAIPTLQQVLGAGNAAAGVGITFSGTSTTIFGANNGINSSGTNEWNGNNTFTAGGNTASTAGLAFGVTGTLWAGGSIGAAGRVLTATGTSVEWATPTVPDNTLQEVLDAGNTATQNITLTGFIRPTTIQDSGGGTGAAGQVLTSDGAGNINWSAAGTGAVASVTGAGAGTSTGTAITIAPTTGAVVVTPNVFDGSSNVGHVPSSAAVGQTTHFLRADGSWQVPTQNNPHGVQTFKYYSYQSGYYVTGTYYTLEKNNSYPEPNTFRNITNPAAPMNYGAEVGGTFFINPGDGACASGVDDLVMCNGKVQIGANQAATYTIRLWKIELCGGVAATQAGSVALTTGAGGMACGDITWVSNALKTLEPGYGFFITFETNTTFTSGLNFAVNLSLRW